jgi:AcrR family transcriptional regulator
MDLTTTMNPAKPSRGRRKAGRPTGDEFSTRAHILARTVDLLKTRAPETLTILEVAAASEVARALVRYYFADMSGLLRCVTEDLMQRLQDRTEISLREEGTLHNRVKRRIELLLAFMTEHPHFERLALTEIYYAKSDAVNTSDTALQRITKRGLELTTALLAGGGVSHADPRFLHLTILAITSFVATTRPLLDTLFGSGEEGKRALESYVDFVTAMIVDQVTTKG